MSLTFDNGPDRAATPFVLEALAARGLTATFFPTGQQLEKPGSSALLDEVADAGHAIGNHTYSHPRPFGALSTAAAIDEIERTEALLNGRQSPLRLFRPSAGGGVMQPGVLNDGVARYLIDKGFTLVLWNLVVEDWRRTDGSWIDLALNGIAKMRWTNLVLHDISSGGISSLNEFLDRAQDSGADFEIELPPDTVPIFKGHVRESIDWLIKH